jgi:hypothetical protein
MLHSFRIPLCVLALALAAACTTSPNGDGGGGSGTTAGTGGTSTGGTTGGQDSGPPGCKVDLDCATFHTLCNVADGGCVLPPHSCDPNHGTSHGGTQCNGIGLTNCTDPNDGSNLCFCKVDHTSDAGGYCYPQLKACATCTNDLDCGAAGDGVDYSGICTMIDAPPNGTSVCLRYEVGGSCSGPSGGGFVPGQVVDGGALCECPNMQCPCGPCMTDSDCTNPALGVCARGGGICEAPCLPGLNQCSAGQVCHVMDKFLNPAVPLEYYGGGRCGPPCATDKDCQSTYYESDGGIPLHCSQTATCRPPQGWCIADFECTNYPHPDASVSPFCDILADGGSACNGADCRLGTNTHDMTALVPFDDCLATYACLLPDGGNPESVPDAGEEYGYGVCELLPCYDISSTFQYGCLNNQFCCGAGDAGTLNPVCTLGQCYCAPNPTWCTTCGANADCKAFTGYVAGPTICAATFAAKNAHCAVSCDKDQPWTCQAGGFCSSFGFANNMSCPAPTTAVLFKNAANADSYGCRCAAGKCATPPLVGGVTLDVGDCSKCPDPSANGCVPDLTSTSDAGVFACVCPADGGGAAVCQGVPGATASTLCLDLGGINLCGNGTPMVWDSKQGFYVTSENCLIRDCTGSGSLDAGC